MAVIPEKRIAGDGRQGESSEARVVTKLLMRDAKRDCVDLFRMRWNLRWKKQTKGSSMVGHFA